MNIRIGLGCLLFLAAGINGLAETENSMQLPIVDTLEAVTTEPRLIRDGTAYVESDNTVLVRNVGRLIVLHKVPEDAGDASPVWLLYDNRDGGHSRMRVNDYPWIARLRYADGFRQGQADRGAQIMFLHNIPVLGNASLALTGNPFWRSMTRILYQQANNVNALVLQYTNNHLYVYPSHEDFGRGHGDVFAANTPYVIIAEGSSGSDQPFLKALVRTLEALDPETRQYLIAQRLLAPTLQMLVRSSLTGVQSRLDYLSGVAHPVAISSGALSEERMIEQAKALRADAVPPMIRLRVIDEDDDTVPGLDYFEAGPAEKLFDTVSAVARIARATRYERRITVSVAETRDPNGRPLTYAWRVLRGDPERVVIRPLDDARSIVELRIAWHERGDHNESGIEGARVDIGAFAYNGVNVSAPAFVTWYFPPNEQREYDAENRIRSVVYSDGSRPATYVDPALVTPAEWTDVYRYGPRGEPLGWERRRGDSVERFTADGKLVIERDERGRPELAQSVVYQRVQESNETAPVLRQVLAPQRTRYTYASDDDLRGQARNEPDADVTP